MEGMTLPDSADLQRADFPAGHDDDSPLISSADDLFGVSVLKPRRRAPKRSSSCRMNGQREETYARHVRSAGSLLPSKRLRALQRRWYSPGRSFDFRGTEGFIPGFSSALFFFVNVVGMFNVEEEFRGCR